MHVLYLTHRRDTPSTRYRVAPFANRLRQDGHLVEILEYSSGLSRLWSALRAARAADVVVLQKKLPPRWIVRALRRRARRLIYDVDDAVYLTHTPTGPEPHEGRVKRFEAVVRAADLVVAGNAHLASQARAAGARSVEVVPTVLDPARYEAATRRPHDGVVAGWIGAGGNLHYFEERLPLLRGLPIRIRVVCDRFPEGVEAVPWSEETEAEAVAGMDIGLAPMPDDPWTRGKCGTRILQYFACAVPVVADDAGVHGELVGEGGFLVQTPEDWVRRVRELASDPSLRRRMGESGHRRLKEQFTPAAVYARVAAFLKG